MRSTRSFQTHALVFLIMVVLLAVVNGLDETWLPLAGLWLIVLVVHGFFVYRLGPFDM